MLAGKSLAEIHATSLPLHAPPVDLQRDVELAKIATSVLAAPAPHTVAVIRSATAATPENPAGAPAWARGARVLQSYGPFQDFQGVLHWVDLIPITRSVQFAFGTAAAAFGGAEAVPSSTIGDLLTHEIAQIGENVGDLGAPERWCSVRRHSRCTHGAGPQILVHDPVSAGFSFPTGPMPMKLDRDFSLALSPTIGVRVRYPSSPVQDGDIVAVAATPPDIQAINQEVP